VRLGWKTSELGQYVRQRSWCVCTCC